MVSELVLSDASLRSAEEAAEGRAVLAERREGTWTQVCPRPMPGTSEVRRRLMVAAGLGDESLPAWRTDGWCR
jgi:hypothetical protein